MEQTDGFSFCIRHQVSLAGFFVQTREYTRPVPNIFTRASSYGNVTAVKNLASKQAKAEYDDCNNLISYVQPGRPDSAKTVLDCGSTYPQKKKRLVYSITSPTGIRTCNSYNANGKLTRSYLIDSMDGSCVIDSQQSYTSDGNHVATKTDSRGKVVAYTTDLAKDTLTSVTDPNGQSVSYTYDSRKRVTGTSATADGKTYKNAYTYENDRLKTVSHNTTSNTPDVTYTFDYDRFGNPTTVKVGTKTLSTNVYTTTGDHTLMRVEYGNGGKVHYTRDDFRCVTGIHYDAATTPRFTYDYGANGQVAYVRDNELNRTVWTEYDTSERPIRSHLLEGSNTASIGTPKYVNKITYDEFGNVSEIVETINGDMWYETYCSHDVENRPTEMMFSDPDRKLIYAYDPIGRISMRKAQGWKTEYSTTYQYLSPENSDGITTTPLVKSITQNGQNFSYTYDNVGNITSETRNGLTTTYVYDKLGQLTRVNDPHAGKSTVYVYDRGGNITSYSEYAYTNGTLGAATKTVGYTYGDSNWKDKVTAIGANAITYDAIGNPLTYDGWTFTWKAGRMLASMVKTGTNAQFTYDHNGLRVKKVVNGVTTSYTLNGKNIVHMTQGSNDLHFYYDAQGKPAMVRLYTDDFYDYFFVYNLQGDVVALVDANGTQVVEYHYDAWGAPLSKTGSLANTIGTLNPFRYRGYVYDEETGLYYLMSRYYNPVSKRFVNADALVSNGKGLLGKNMFAYCNNCPTGESDPTGQSAINLVLVLVLAAFSLSGCSANKETPPRDYTFSDSKNQNCYGYAFGFVNGNTNPGDYTLRRSQPSTIEKEYRTVTQIAALVEADMQMLGRKVRIIESPNEVQNDEYVVALKTTTSSFFDYHFARQLSDKTWADKQGQSASRWDGLDGDALVWDGPFFMKYDSDTVYFAVKEY